ncbi:MAG: 3-phosphoserine/phosphohydroxythreonine transaminase [Francisellaceae bacterium]|nr:3-phosphoserine/phosphohydroxythreonine transaminase [Francisellaceae bacterium]MBT6539476.1 3-phosphoserine/phosphohydroxythreonine transaminase [Francisellaceae bacterium]
MKKSFNFGAGPGMLPASVKSRIKSEIDNWHQGMSVMEISHRSKKFIELASNTTKKIRDLLKIPDKYEVLFLSGGARTQFSMLPLNLLNKSDTADYLISGFWSQWAYEDAAKLRQVNIIGNSFEEGYLSISIPNRITSGAKYIHYTDNETIHGVEYKNIPIKTSVPLVADMTSSILSKPIDVSKHAAIYASCQKNMGIAGLTVVIIDPSCLREPDKIMPDIMRYSPFIASKSMTNTPPVFPWYVLDLMLDWLLEQGGIDSIHTRNKSRAKKLYNYIDSSHLYGNAINEENRSDMNITFHLVESNFDDIFKTRAEKNGLYQLGGHRMIGGFRASLYNAMPDEGVDRLIDFMREFENDPYAK